MLAHEQGLDVVAVGAARRPAADLDDLAGEVGIKGIADLRGKTIATAGIPYQDAYLKTILARANLSPDDVKTVNVGFGLLPALVGGSADAMLGGFSNVEGVDLRDARQGPGRHPGRPARRPHLRRARPGRPARAASKKTRSRSGSSSPPSRAAPRPRSQTRSATVDALLEANPDLDPKLTRAEVEGDPAAALAATGR